MLMDQEIVRESPNECQQAIERLNVLLIEIGQIPVVLTVDEIYYSLLSEEKKKQFIPDSIEYQDTFVPYKEKDQNTLSLSSYMKTGTISSLSPNEKKQYNGHSEAIEKWKRMLKWKEA